MDWKNFIPKEEHHLYEITNKEELLDPFFIQNNYSDSYINEKIPFKDVKDIFEIISISEEIKKPYEVLKDFAFNNIPKNYVGSKENFCDSVMRFYTETLADNLLPYTLADDKEDFEVTDNVKTAHKLALVKTYVQILELNKNKT